MKNLIYCTLIVISLIFTSCKKQEDSNNPVPSKPNQLTYYFKADIEGVEHYFEETEKPPYGDAINYVVEDLYSMNGKWLDNVESAFFNNYGWGENSYWISFYSEIEGQNIPTKETRINKVSTGPQEFYNYNAQDSSMKPGFGINHYDHVNEVFWSTFYGSADQKSSTFTITEISNCPDTTALKVFRVTFSCTLYSEDSTISKSITGSSIFRMFKEKPQIWP